MLCLFGEFERVMTCDRVMAGLERAVGGSLIGYAMALSYLGQQASFAKHWDQVAEATSIHGMPPCPIKPAWVHLDKFAGLADRDRD